MALQRGILKAQTPEITDFRVLSRADLTILSETRPTKTLQSLRDSHHRVARAMAAGLPGVEISQLCGISQSRVSMYKNDPAFMELVAHYRGLITAEYVRSVDSFMEVATSNMLKAAVMIGDKLDDAIDKGEFLPTRDLLAIHDTGADRFGYGKMQKNLNVNVDFASQLEQARKRSRQAKDISPPLAPNMTGGDQVQSPAIGTGSLSGRQDKPVESYLIEHSPSGAQSDPASPQPPAVRSLGPPSFRRV